MMSTADAARRFVSAAQWEKAMGVLSIWHWLILLVVVLLELELPRYRGGFSACISSRLRLLGRSLVHGRRGACDAGAGGGQGGFVGSFEVQR